MPVPTSYTEAELADYMLALMGDFADIYNVVQADMMESVYDVAIAYGVSDISEATDIEKVRLLANVETWRFLIRRSGVGVDFTDGEISIKSSQLRASLEQLLTDAIKDATVVMPRYQVKIYTMGYTGDWFLDNDDDEAEY